MPDVKIKRRALKNRRQIQKRKSAVLRAVCTVCTPRRWAFFFLLFDFWVTCVLLHLDLFLFHRHSKSELFSSVFLPPFSLFRLSDTVGSARALGQRTDKKRGFPWLWPFLPARVMHMDSSLITLTLSGCAVQKKIVCPSIKPHYGIFTFFGWWSHNLIDDLGTPWLG